MTPAMDRLASRQHGLITGTQFGRLGLSRRQVAFRTRSGSIDTVRHNVHRLAGAPVTWEQAVMAAALAAGPTATVSHTTAAAVWGLKHSDRHPAGLHLTRPTQIRLVGVIGHVCRLHDADRTVHRFIPVTTPERTIMDLAGTLTARQLAECVDDALRRRLIRLDRLRSLVDRAAARGGRRLLEPLHDVLADRIPGYRPGDSDWEQEMDRQWDRLGLPPAQRQYPVKAAGHTFRIDRAIPEFKVGVEWEGYEWHGSRSRFDGGSDRTADLTAVGWHMIRFTSKSTPKRIVAAVLQAVDERRPRTAEVLPAAPGRAPGRTPARRPKPDQEQGGKLRSPLPCRREE